MSKERKFSPDKLPGRDLMAIADYVKPTILERAYDHPNLAPTRGPGKHSLANALERRRFWESAPPTFLYTDEQALQHRRNHNRSLFKPRGKNR